MKGSLGWMGLVAVVGLVACTHANPDFDEGPTGADSNGPAGTVDGGGTVTDPSMPTVDPSADTSAGTTSPTSGSPTGSSNTNDPTSDPTGDTDPTDTDTGSCAPTFGALMQLTIEPTIDDPFCLGETAMQVTGTSGGMVQARFCTDCECPDSAMVRNVTFDMPPPAPPLDLGCYVLRRDLHIGSDTGCEVDAYGIYDSAGAEPLWVVSNVQDPMFDTPFSFMFDGESLDTCVERCDELPPGNYSLVSNGDSVPPNGAGVPFGNGLTAHNMGSGVTLGCESVYRWWAGVGG